MNSWQRWLKAPQTLWLRNLVFQVHLWMGIGVGVYIFAISFSGSAFVLSPDFHSWFVASEVASAEGPALRGPALESRITEVYSDYEVTDSMVSSLPTRAVYVTLQKDGERHTRFFDHYAGEDLGDTFPWQVASVEWLVDLHDDLLMGRTGRRINGIGGGFFLLMMLTGLLIWWQGKARWHESLIIKPSSQRSLIWQLHSFIGFWSLLLMFAWGVTGLYFAFPSLFNSLIDFFDDDLTDFERPTGFIQFLIDLHFGRFEDTWARIIWALLGLLPALMFISGFILWWRRVVRKRSAA